MTRIQVACYTLIASAFILTGLLLDRVTDGASPFESTANASMVSNKASFTMLTARTRSPTGDKPGEECLFIVDDVSNLLLIYRVEPRSSGGKAELLHFEDLSRAFRLEG